MRSTKLKSLLTKSGLAASVLLLASGAAFGQQQVNLTAAASTVTLPDGTVVPMWGYSCDAVQVAGTAATCAKLNPAATGWSPVVITVPTTATGGLAIQLTNNLTFTPTGGGANTVPTSIVIVGQLGGGLGSINQTAAPGNFTDAPDHSNAQPVTWPIAGSTPGTAPQTGVGTPPQQGKRVQSFATQVAAGSTTLLPAWATLRPGTYLIESGTHPSIQGPMGLYGILVVTTAPTGTGTSAVAGTAYPGVTYNAEVPLLLSEIDPLQNGTVSKAVNTAGFSETKVWSGLPGGCGNPSPGNTNYLTCYPPAVNYTPLYYLFNGVAFDKTNAAASLFPTSPATGLTANSGKILIRFVNAGLRMHVPSIVNSLTGASASPGFSLIAEDGNPLPGIARVQSEVFMAAGKTSDVMVNVPVGASAVAPPPALAVFDRELSLSGNATSRDAGMLAYVGVNGAGLPSAAAAANNAPVAQPDTYNSVIAGQTLTVSDPGKGLIANDTNIYGVHVVGTTPSGLSLNADGTFTYTGGTPTTFTYCGNGATSGAACAMVTLGAAPLELASGITCTVPAPVAPATSTYAATATSLSIKPPGILSFCKDAAGYPLTVNAASVPTVCGGGTLSVDPNGGFNVTGAAGSSCSFTFKAQNSQNTVSGTAASVSVAFPSASGLQVKVYDGTDKTTLITDYRWIIEEDRTFYVDPHCTQNPPTAGCPGYTGTATPGIVPTFGTNFHTSYMPVVAAGCTGAVSCENGQTLLGAAAVCDIGNGVCRTTGAQQAVLTPDQVHLDPTKRYYISILPGDAANPFIDANLTDNCTKGQLGANQGTADAPARCGHGMGGAPIAAPCAIGSTGCTTAFAPVTIWTQPAPYPPAKLSVFVFEDDFPLNGEQDAGGGIDVLATNEPGLGHFNITLFDDAGGTGDATGQMTYDMFNQPLANSLAGTIDPATQLDACPISTHSRQGVGDLTQTGITGTIVTCPKFEATPNGGAVSTILSPLAGQAVIANLMPGRYGVVATPAADRIARGEEWLQTNTLDGQKAHDSFLRIGEPSFFQEFGPAGYHVSIGFASPQIINSRHAGVCNGTDVNVTGSNCSNTVTGKITTERMSRTPDERLYSSGSNDSFAFTQCYVSLGDTDGEDFAFTKCNPDGTFTLTNIPQGNWRVTVFDQWNDMLVDGLSTPVGIANGGGQTVNLGDIAMNQWQANIYTTSFIDNNRNGVRDPEDAGLLLAPTNIRFRDGSYSNFNNTDLSGNAGFNEEFPLFSWYVIESDQTRFKNTGTHVVYDAGGAADGCGNTDPTAPCGSSAIASFYANTVEQIPVPAALRVPGAYYCATADCTAAPASTSGPPAFATGPGGSTGRVDPPWVQTEGWQGFSGQNSFLEFGKTPYKTGENGGIRGEVTYASTRPFDDPALLIHTSWTPNVPNVTINLYQVGAAADGSQSLKLVDTTKTTSWDDWAQGFRSDGNPNMNCPGQGTDKDANEPDLFFFTLYNQPMYLDLYSSQHNGSTLHTLPNNAQYKCYDGMHNWNQLQPAPYDGAYTFPSIIGRNPTTGAPTGTGTATGAAGSRPGTNCTVCVANPDDGTPMLPMGKYVVEVVVPPGYELVKEEDKNILIGDNYIAPATVQFPNLAGSVYILPDQAEVAAAYNANNAQNSTNAFGRTTLPSHEGDTGSVETFWPCVGQARVVPDYISLFPLSQEVAPFAGATRNLCDRKLVTLDDQTSALAKFWIFSSTHVAAHFTGVITDDFTSEFDPFSPQFGEKFSPPNMPISLKDWTGTEISRVYADQWGTYNGLTYSTWEVNPPNPTGYAPTMMVTCMNDPGTGTTPDPLYNPQYSQFCYEIPFMPGQTQYMDTPVVPTSAFAGAGYNNPDCAYPDATPAIKEVDGDGVGPWIAAAGPSHPITIHALGAVVVPNNAYSGPSATAAPFNQKTVTRNYFFGTTQGTVTIGGVAATVTSWLNDTIVAYVPATGTQVPLCTIQQQAQYAGVSSRCGELVITAGNGKQSIDTVTVTIENKTPTRITAPSTSASTGSPFGPIQAAINKAAPGDLIIVQPGVYNEILLMWKPVRLQGVGAASSIINANSQPAGRMDSWRAAVNCLFGLALNGQPYSTSGNLVPLPGGGGFEPLNPYDATGAQSCPASGWNYFGGGPNNPQVDRIPLEGILGWDTTLNGNLAELLQEPSLMGAYEGAGITVLAKGVRYPAGLEVFGAATDTEANSNVAHEGQMPAFVDPVTGNIHGTLMLTNSAADCNTKGSGAKTGYTSNFMCSPSRIDGLSITNSSQGGGGIYVHGWAHFLEIANNRVNNNTGTLTGGITVGQGESPDALLAGNEGDPVGFDQQPWTCNDLVPGAENPNAGRTAVNQNVSPGGWAANTQLPYCYNEKVNVHHNAVTSNSSIGDELFSSTPAGAGGVTFCVGADYYKFNYNWVCGNLSTGDGGGLAHLGFIWNGDIEHNTFLFNQSTNPTVPTNGGGIIVMGAAPDGTLPTQAPGTECGSVTDVDCAPGLSDGTGPGTTINANLIMGNAAESGSGGGIRLQDVNGTDVGFFPLAPLPATFFGAKLPGWNSVTITNNIIANNVAGWDGAGISLQDALVANVINNTIMSNDTTASSGVLFNTLGAGLASAPGPTCTSNCGTASPPQAAGVVTMQNTTLLTSSLIGRPVICPAGHGSTLTQNCKNFSIPRLDNDVIFDNRSFYIGVGGAGAGTLNQQNIVTLYNSFTTTPAASEPTTDATTPNGGGLIITGGTGACVNPVSYWDIGVRGDTGPTNHSSGLTLTPTYSVLTPPATGYTGATLNNTVANPTVLSQYCNGSRTPPEFKSLGYQVPPGIADATVPNPVFNLTPAATVDEGNNWINLSWGPLAETNAVSGALLGNYGPAAGSSVINYIPASAGNNYTEAPSTDFYGNPRKTNNTVDAGAVEFVAGAGPAIASVTGGPLSFGNAVVNSASAPQTLTLTNSGGANLTGITLAFSSPRYARPAGAAGGTCGASGTATLAGGASCTINVVFTPTAVGAVPATLTITASVGVTGSPVTLTGTGVAPSTVSVTPNPLTITLPTGTASGTATVTLTNTGATAPVTVSAVAVSGGSLFTWFFNAVVGADNCTGTTLAPGATCTVGVRFTNVLSARGVNRTGTITFTDNATGSPQAGNLIGHAN